MQMIQVAAGSHGLAKLGERSAAFRFTRFVGRQIA
jgi:hypothetical protein